jgi:hypothetical protein
VPAATPAGGPGRGYDPTLYLYEHVPGGTGLSERVYEQQSTLLPRALALIARCPCQAGCPACVGPADPMQGQPSVPANGKAKPPFAGQTAAPLTRKALALDLLKDAVPARVRASLAWGEGHATGGAGAVALASTAETALPTE